MKRTYWIILAFFALAMILVAMGTHPHNCSPNGTESLVARLSDICG